KRIPKQNQCRSAVVDTLRTKYAEFDVGDLPKHQARNCLFLYAWEERGNALTFVVDLQIAKTDFPSCFRNIPNELKRIQCSSPLIGQTVFILALINDPLTENKAIFLVTSGNETVAFASFEIFQ